MEENKNLAKDGQNGLTPKSNVVRKFWEAQVAKGGDNPPRRLVGNNGYAPGDMFVLDGTVVEEFITDAKGKPTENSYLAVGTDNGKLSIKSLMGLSSLRGYETSGKFLNEYQVAADGGLKLISEEVVAETLPGFTWADLYHPETRDFIELADDWAEDESLIKDKVFLYVGIVCRQFTNRRAGAVDLSHDNAPIPVGAKRVMTARLWAFGTKAEMTALKTRLTATR